MITVHISRNKIIPNYQILSKNSLSQLFLPWKGKDLHIRNNITNCSYFEHGIWHFNSLMVWLHHQSSKSFSRLAWQAATVAAYLSKSQKHSVLSYHWFQRCCNQCPSKDFCPVQCITRISLKCNSYKRQEYHIATSNNTLPWLVVPLQRSKYQWVEAHYFQQVPLELHLMPQQRHASHTTRDNNCIHKYAHNKINLFTIK